MGKTICLLIVFFSIVFGEFVGSKNPVRNESVGIPNWNSSQKYKKSQNYTKKTAKNTDINATNESNLPKAKILNPAQKTMNFKKAKKSDEFIFWAQFSTHNQMLSTRIIALSKAMKKSDESEFEPFCELKTPRFFKESELEYFKRNEELLADCFTRSSFKVLEFSNYALRGANLRTNITQIPVNFIAVFKGYGATILAKINKD